ncbi:MAG: uL22 family ribosomal protein [archaeon]
MTEKNKPVEKKEEKQVEQTKEEKPKEKKPQKQVRKLEKVMVKAHNLPISFKHSVAICRFIKNKNPKDMIEIMEKVEKKKRAIPMKGELPHRKNMPKGQPRGRYPTKAARYFKKMLKNLIGNANVGNMDTENLKMTTVKADTGMRQIRGTRMGYGRKRFKRTHIFIEAEENKPKEKK